MQKYAVKYAQYAAVHILHIKFRIYMHSPGPGHFADAVHGAVADRRAAGPPTPGRLGPAIRTRCPPATLESRSKSRVPGRRPVTRRLSLRIRVRA